MPHPERPPAGEDPERLPAAGEDDLEIELSRRRARALAALDRPDRGRRWLPVVPLLAIFVAWLVLGGVHRFRARTTVIPLHGYEVVLTGPSSPGFYRRLRFYRWLAHEEHRP